MNSRMLETAKPFIRPNFKESTVNGLKFAFSRLNFDLPLQFDGEYSTQVKELWDRVKKGEHVNNMIIILADSFGMANVAEHAKLFDSIRDHIVELHTCFPTTTSTVMTSLSHVTFPSVHGLVGYNMWHESVGELVNTLNLKTKKNGKIVHVNDLALNKDDFITGQSLAEIVMKKAKEEGKTINLKLFKPESLERDGIMQFLFPLEYLADYPDLDPSKAVNAILTDLNDPSFDHQLFVLYYPHCDYASHYFGSKSQEYVQAVQLLTKILLTVTRHSSVLEGKTAVVLTSDHGQVDLPAMGTERRVVLDENTLIELRAQKLVLASTGRMLQAYFLDEDRGERALDEFLNDLGTVSNHLQLLGKHEALPLFGPTVPSKKIQARVGDKLLLMDEHVFIDCPSIVPYGADLPLQADHGSLTPREVKVPFMVL